MRLVASYSQILSMFKIKNRVIYLMSFPDNDKGFIEELGKQAEVIVLYKKKCKAEVLRLKKQGIRAYPLDHAIYFVVRVIPLLTQSRIIIIDNYFPVVGALKKRNQIIIQIWHAIGAIKKFGLEDKQTVFKTTTDLRRYTQVYQAIDKYVVASNNMGKVFERSYGAKEEQLLYFGLPRADHLARQIQCQVDKKQKKQILYAPTYREGQEELPPLDLKRLEKELSDEYHLIIKLHPHIQHLMKNKQDTDFITWHRSDQGLDELIQKSDVLITDYSSVVFDYSLWNPLAPIIFFWYDQEEYDELIGIQNGLLDMELFIPARNTAEIIEQLMNPKVMVSETLNKTWNSYNDGASTQRLIDYILEILGETK